MGQIKAEPEPGQSIYLVLFSNGTLKVGRGERGRRRITEHRYEAARYGVSVVRYWVSDRCVDYHQIEATLLQIAGRLGEITYGREYFRYVDFDDLLADAKRLTNTGSGPGQRPTLAESQLPAPRIPSTEEILSRLYSLPEVAHLASMDVEFLIDLARCNWSTRRPHLVSLMPSIYMRQEAQTAFRPCPAENWTWPARRAVRRNERHEALGVNSSARPDRHIA
jgi:hypothetical protein